MKTTARTPILVRRALRTAGVGLLVAGVALFSPITSAQAPLSGLAAVASASPQEIMRRLRRGHAQVDALLRARASQAAKVAQLQNDRDAAAGRVDQMKQRNERGTALEKSLRQALVLDENYTFAQSQLVALDGEIAREGAQLLRLYDAILIEKNKEARKFAKNHPGRQRAQQAYRALAQRRDGIRQALLPVMGQSSAQAPAAGAEFVARPDDDIESLMEKADLARDLETRFLRRAQAVRKRIQQLEAERTLARDVIGIASTDSLFDESDHRVLISRTNVRAGAGVATPVGGGPTLFAAESLSAGAPPQVADDRAAPVGQEFNEGEPPAPGGVDVPAAPPTDDGTAADPDLTNGFESADNDGLVDQGAGRESPTVVAPPLPAGVTERAFLGDTSERELAALMASDTLTLPQLRALEKKLEREASRLRGQSKKLRKEVKTRARSRRR